MIEPRHGRGRRRRAPLRIATGLALAGLLSVSAVAHAQDPSPAATPGAAAPGIDGTWLIDGEIGDFADYSSSWVGFRVAEELQGLGDVFAVGRTPAVSGSLEVSGTTIGSAAVEVDLTTITSDQRRRDPAIQRALDTTTFPTATIQSREAVDLGAVPVDGEPFSVTVPATLTIRDVAQDVDVQLTGQKVGDVVVVVGTLPVDFTAFDVTMPTAPMVLSVADNGDLEWQLFFRRQTDDAGEQGTEGESERSEPAASATPKG